MESNSAAALSANWGPNRTPGSSSGIAYEAFEATSVVPAITHGPPLAPAFISQSIPIPAGSIVASMIVVGESHVDSRSPSNGGSAGYPYARQLWLGDPNNEIPNDPTTSSTLWPLADGATMIDPWSLGS